MAKTRIIYNQIGVYAGGAPSTGYHFIASDGVQNNNWENVSDNFPLVFPLKRVQSASFSFEVPRTNISNLGDYSTISRPVLNKPEISLNLSYYLMGLINEARLGFLMNTHWNGATDEYQLYGANRVSLLSGLYSRDYTPSSDSDYNWPLKSREPRNIFVAVQKDSFDLNNVLSGEDLSTKYKNSTVNVYGFGDCYLTSYQNSAAVNQIPQTSVGFVANNVVLYSSGLCCDIPAMNTRTYNSYSGTKFSIPNNFEGTGLPTVLIPSDISISIKRNIDNSENLTDLFLDFNDIKIQSYSFNINLNRSPLYSIGHKLPLDRTLTSPITSDLTFDFLPGDKIAGELTSLIKSDQNYDISIKLSYQRGQIFNGVAIQYDFIKAKLNGFDESASISEKMSNSLSFTTELDPLKTDAGVFITGYLGIPNTASSVITLGDDFDGGGIDDLLFEDGDLFLINLSGYKLLY